MAVVVTRAFTLEDQRRFAELSGDHNPIHVDPVYARRSVFGEVVVHGVHGLLFALDRALAAEGGSGPLSIVELNAQFSQPLRIGDEVAVDLVERSGEYIRLHLMACGRVASKVTAVLAPARSVAATIPDHVPDSGHPPQGVQFSAAAVAAGSLPLMLASGLATQLFPALMKRLSPCTVAELLASTRLVGMFCPGLHSLFAGLELFVNTRLEDPEPALAFGVAMSDARYRKLDLAVQGPTLSGKLLTFMRPEPVAQPSLVEVGRRVLRNEFAGQRALVVGGTRGLGEVTAKCLAAGGAAVAITYHRGEADARRVVEELGSEGASAMAMQFDAGSPPSDLAVRLGSLGAPSHLYFFATPHIRVDRKQVFAAHIFQELARIYVEGFAATVQCVRGLGDDELSVLYPSTVFIDELPAGAGEYVAAKASGEAVARHLARVLPRTRIATPRLPRMRTDQTAAILDLTALEPLDVILKTLRELASSQR